LLVGYRDGRLDVWDVATKAKLYSLKGEDCIEVIATSPDGTRIVGGSHLAKLFVWNADTHELIHTLKGHGYRIEAVALSPDGKQILSGAFESNVILWDAETGKQLRTFQTRASSTSCVLFSPDGKSAIAGNSAGMTIWDIDLGDELGQLIVFDKENWLVVTPDGHFDGSPEGIRRVTFLSDDRLSVTPAEKVDSALLQPGLLAKLLNREQP
jgi:WD40 repeat protein